MNPPEPARPALSAGSDLSGLNTPVPAVRTIDGATILLFGRTYFDILDPEASAFHIGDIAHGLSQVCRFAAQCPRFYSVAEHSVHVSRIVPPEHRLSALMHDAAEAFIGDVATPLKVLLGDYGPIEARIEAAIFARFGIPPVGPEVKHADVVMLATEQRALWNNRDRWKWTGRVAPLDLELPCWAPREAREQFLQRYEELCWSGVGDGG